jgi:hypothetical protein
VLPEIRAVAAIELRHMRELRLGGAALPGRLPVDEQNLAIEEQAQLRVRPGPRREAVGRVSQR